MTAPDERPDRGVKVTGKFAANARAALLCVLIAAAAGGAVMLYAGLPTEFELSTRDLATFMTDLGMWGYLAVIGLMIIHSFVPFPAEFVAFAAGMSYGPLWGTVLTWTGAMIGAALSFALVRALGRPFATAMLPARQLRRIDGFTDRHGAATLLLVRLVPMIAFNLINYAAGLTRVGWPTFLWTTGVGILPLTLIMVVFGARMHELTWFDWVAFLVFVIAIWAVTIWVKSRYNPLGDQSS